MCTHSVAIDTREDQDMKVDYSYSPNHSSGNHECEKLEAKVETNVLSSSAAIRASENNECEQPHWTYLGIDGQWRAFQDFDEYGNDAVERRYQQYVLNHKSVQKLKVFDRCAIVNFSTMTVKFLGATKKQKIHRALVHSEG